MRSALRWVAGLVAVLAVAGCGAGVAGEPGDAGAPREPAGTPAAPSPAAAGDPVGLVGLWTVREAAGEEPGAILRLAEREASLWRRCGAIFGAWNAGADGLFVAGSHGGSGACYDGPQDVPGWLRQAVGHRAAGRDRLLVDRAGRTLARLVPGGRPTVGPDTSPTLAEPPEVTPELRRLLAPAAPLPAGLRPPAATELAHRWVPVSSPDGRVRPFAQLRADGTWSGSDGCNGQGGRWVAGAAGSFLAVAGAQTLIGCAGVDVGSWLSGAARAGFAGDQLVLLDRSGRELGRLRAG